MYILHVHIHVAQMIVGMLNKVRCGGVHQQTKESLECEMSRQQGNNLAQGNINIACKITV